jgi:hypothetical protein
MFDCNATVGNAGSIASEYAYEWDNKGVGFQRF